MKQIFATERRACVVFECTVFGTQEIDVQMAVCCSGTPPVVAAWTHNDQVTVSVASVGAPLAGRTVVRLLLCVEGRFVNGQRCKVCIGDALAGPARC